MKEGSEGPEGRKCRKRSAGRKEVQEGSLRSEVKERWKGVKDVKEGESEGSTEGSAGRT